MKGKLKKALKDALLLTTCILFLLIVGSFISFVSLSIIIGGINNSLNGVEYIILGCLDTLCVFFLCFCISYFEL